VCHGEGAETIQAFDQVGRNGGDAVQSHQSSPLVMKQTWASAGAGIFDGGADSRPGTVGSIVAASD
jgi:hypothetical protein